MLCWAVFAPLLYVDKRNETGLVCFVAELSNPVSCRITSVWNYPETLVSEEVVMAGSSPKRSAGPVVGAWLVFAVLSLLIAAPLRKVILYLISLI